MSTYRRLGEDRAVLKSPVRLAQDFTMASLQLHTTRDALPAWDRGIFYLGDDSEHHRSAAPQREVNPSPFACDVNVCFLIKLSVEMEGELIPNREFDLGC